LLVENLYTEMLVSNHLTAEHKNPENHDFCKLRVFENKVIRKVTGLNKHDVSNI